MNKTNFIIGAVAVVALLFGVTAYFSPKTITQVVDNVGAVTSNEQTSETQCLGGYCTSYLRTGPILKSATTTACAFRAKNLGKNATISSLRLNIATGSSTPITLVIATSSNPYSTTTQTGPIVSDFVLPASFTGGYDFTPMLISTSTIQAGYSMPSNVLSKSVLAANEYVLFILQGSNQSGFGGSLSTSIRATCDTILREF